MQIYGTKTVATVQPRRHMTIAYPAPREVLIGPPVVIPAADPGVPQISFTIDAGDIPTLTGVQVDHVTLVPMLYIAGNSLDSGVHPLAFSVTKNGNYLDSGVQSTQADAKWILNIFPYIGNAACAVGDVIEITLFSDDVLLDLAYYACALAVTRPRVASTGTILLNADFQSMVTFPALTTPGVVNTAANFSGATSTGFGLGALGFGATIAGLTVDVDAPLYAVSYGDSTSGVEIMVGDGALWPYYGNIVPTDITWYPTSIRVV